MTTITTDTDLGRFVFDVRINSDRRQLDVTFVEPWNGDHGYEKRMERVLGLLHQLKFSQAITRNHSLALQAYTEGLLIGACACFFTLAKSTAITATIGGDKLDDYALRDLALDENTISFQTGCKILFKQLTAEVEHVRKAVKGRREY